MINLASLRRKAGVTQVQLARSLGTSQGQISRLEGQHDMLLSTLSAYLTALGVNATVVIAIADQRVEYGLTGREGRR